MARVEVSVLYDVRNRLTVKREFHSKCQGQVWGRYRV